MPKYVKITRSDLSGSYIVSVEEAPGMVQSELDGIEYDTPGTSITLTAVEMSRDEFENLPEFKGW